MADTIPPRSKVDKKLTWNAESVFPSVRDWDVEVGKIVADIPSVRKYKGRLAGGASVLLEAMSAIEQISLRANKAYMYAGFLYAVDTTNQQAAGLRGKAAGMFGQV